MQNFNSFGWDVAECDGHDECKLFELLFAHKSKKSDKPFCIVADTIKGKCSFMQNSKEWHTKLPKDNEIAMKHLTALRIIMIELPDYYKNKDKIDFRDATFGAVAEVMKNDTESVLLTNDMGALGIDKIAEFAPESHQCWDN